MTAVAAGVSTAEGQPVSDPALIAWRVAASRAAGPFLAPRLGMLLLAFTGAWTAQQTVLTSWGGYLERWNRWDVKLFARLARYSYSGDHPCRRILGCRCPASDHAETAAMR